MLNKITSLKNKIKHTPKLILHKIGLLLIVLILFLKLTFVYMIIYSGIIYSIYLALTRNNLGLILYIAVIYQILGTLLLFIDSKYRYINLDPIFKRKNLQSGSVTIKVWKHEETAFILGLERLFNTLVELWKKLYETFLTLKSKPSITIGPMSIRVIHDPNKIESQIIEAVEDLKKYNVIKSYGFQFLLLGYLLQLFQMIYSKLFAS